MVFRILGAAVGLLFVLVPAISLFDGKTPVSELWLAPFLGLLFLTYGFMGPRRLSHAFSSSKSFLFPELSDLTLRQLGDYSAPTAAHDAPLAIGDASKARADGVPRQDAHLLEFVRYPVEFTATTSGYFRIWVVNLGLTIATLGIYSAWAKVRKRRYLYGHTRIGGEGFEYLARPLPILKGRLIALGLLIAVFAAGRFVPVLTERPWIGKVAFIALLVAIGPWIIVRSFAFNAHNTTYRNVRLRFDATYAACFKVVAVYGWLLLFGFLYPYFKRRLVEFVAANHYYGTTRFVLNDFMKPFIAAYWSGPSWHSGSWWCWSCYSQAPCLLAGRSWS